MLRKIMFAAAVLAAASLSLLSPSTAGNGPTDPEIAHIAYTAGIIDIGYAELALEMSDNQDVREFAETMLRDHKAVNDAALALLEKLGVAPQDNSTSQSLSQQAADKRAELGALEGDAFDKAYADNELAYHQFVNQTLAETLIPEADNAELKALLGSALETFTAHEMHAEQLVQITR